MRGQASFRRRDSGLRGLRRWIDGERQRRRSDGHANAFDPHAADLPSGDAQRPRVDPALESAVNDDIASSRGLLNDPMVIGRRNAVFIAGAAGEAQGRYGPKKEHDPRNACNTATTQTSRVHGFLPVGTTGIGVADVVSDGASEVPGAEGCG